MARLVLYPKERFTKREQEELAAQQPTVYLPLRTLTEKPLSPGDQQIMQTADVLVISSNFALTVLMAWLPKVAARTIVVLSQQQAEQLQTQYTGTVCVAPTENQQGLAQQVAALPQALTVVWLVGTLTHVAHQLQANERVVTAYQNRWTASDEAQALTAIGTTRYQQVLVPSASAYQRLQTLMRRRPAQFSDCDFYALGQQTAAVIQADGHHVWVPPVRKAVLRQAVRALLQPTD
ncbi:hypothetical protein ACRYI5_08980 [Furfurilactobacillus sp. WILCCON 0119]